MVGALADGRQSEYRPPAIPLRRSSDLPTIAEQVSGIRVRHWFGFFAPAGTPPEAMKKTRACGAASLATEPGQGATGRGRRALLPGPGRGIRQVDLQDVERWAKLVREGRVQPVD